MFYGGYSYKLYVKPNNNQKIMANNIEEILEIYVIKQDVARHSEAIANYSQTYEF